MAFATKECSQTHYTASQIQNVPGGGPLTPILMEGVPYPPNRPTRILCFPKELAYPEQNPWLRGARSALLCVCSVTVYGCACVRGRQLQPCGFDKSALEHWTGSDSLLGPPVLAGISLVINASPSLIFPAALHFTRPTLSSSSSFRETDLSG